VDPTEAWNRQWRAPLLSTLAGSLDGPTLALIEAGWAEFFRELPAKARVLDVGTGNGYLALLALDNGKRFEVHGADAASIDPPQALPALRTRLEKIRFHPDTPAEDLRFADATFDAVVGQHALEYADIKGALREIARVLKPGGRIRFLLHAAESEILNANVPKIRQYRFVLNEARLFELTEQSVAAALAGKGDGGKALREALTLAASRFQDDANTGDLTALLGLLGGCFDRRGDFSGLPAVRAWLAENRAETEAALARIEAMERAGVPEAALGQIAAWCREAGLENAAAAKLSTRSGGLLGWVLTAAKSERMKT
jgi:SAM-dependent methyltransferase